MEEELYTHEEVATIAENMRAYGGSFVKTLGELISKADYPNTRKLERTFPEYFDQYLNTYS
jgi:DNA-binding ferritin-like protein